MKRIMFVLAAFIGLTAYTTLNNNTWLNDDFHSQVGFTVTHLGIADVSGSFNDFDVVIKSEKPDFSDARVSFVARVASIDTRVEPRDNHLKSADFFDAEKYPTIDFKSTGLKKAGRNKYKLSGDLTMHGITRQVTMKLEFRGTTVNAMNQKQTAGFRVTGEIDRSDFNIGNGFPPPMISNKVTIKADGEFTQN